MRRQLAINLRYCYSDWRVTQNISASCMPQFAQHWNRHFKANGNENNYKMRLKQDV